MNQSQKKSHLRKSIAITIIIVAIILISFVIVGYNYRFTIYDESSSISIPPGSYYYIMLYLSSFSSKFFLTISFKASGGAGNDIRCYVIDRTNFINWENGHQVYAIYDSGKVTAAYDTIYLKGSGTYYIVFDNTFSVFSSKTVYYSITVKTTLL
jgi:hypothetical protein